MKDRKKIDAAFPEIQRPDGGPASAETKEAILRDMLGVEAQKWTKEITDARGALVKAQDRVLCAERAVEDMRRTVLQMQDIADEAREVITAKNVSIYIRRDSILGRVLTRLKLV